MVEYAGGGLFGIFFLNLCIIVIVIAKVLFDLSGVALWILIIPSPLILIFEAMFSVNLETTVISDILPVHGLSHLVPNKFIES